MMLLSGGIFTLAIALLSAQGARQGGAKGKAAAHPAAATIAKTTKQTATKSVKRPAPPTSVRPHVVPAPRKVDIGDTAASSTAASSDSPVSDGAAAAATTRAAKTKVYTFGAMDVEGKLKTPQLLYFLNRIKLELDMSAPDHRSFMKELERTAEDPNL